LIVISGTYIPIHNHNGSLKEKVRSLFTRNFEKQFYCYRKWNRQEWTKNVFTCPYKEKASINKTRISETIKHKTNIKGQKNYTKVNVNLQK
jgi:hypothetical protein